MVALFDRRLAVRCKLQTTAFSRGYTLSPLRGWKRHNDINALLRLVWTHPSEPAVQEPESIEIRELKLRVDLVAIHITIEH